MNNLGSASFFIISIFLTRRTGSLNCRQQSLKWHNYYRKIHQVGKVTWSNKLAQNAEIWANYLATNNLLEHDSNDPGNLFISPGKPKEPCTDAVKLFYTEEKHYNYKKPELSTGIVGHFTQLVWKNTKQIGAFTKVRNDGKTVVVVKYSPPGNVRGRYKENVFPPRKTSPTEKTPGTATPRVTTSTNATAGNVTTHQSKLNVTAGVKGLEVYQEGFLACFQVGFFLFKHVLNI